MNGRGSRMRFHYWHHHHHWDRYGGDDGYSGDDGYDRDGYDGPYDD
jgi:hypothetical protein